MRIDWTKVGAEYTGTQHQRDMLLHAVGEIGRAKEPQGREFDCWLPIPKYWEPPLRLAMMQGMGIQETIKQFKLPGVTHVAIAGTSFQGSYGLYGIRCHYERGRQQVDVWVIDSGVRITPVFMCVYAKTPEEVVIA
jgi:hypothetical protein